MFLFWIGTQKRIREKWNRKLLAIHGITHQWRWLPNFNDMRNVCVWTIVYCVQDFVIRKNEILWITCDVMLLNGVDEIMAAVMKNGLFRILLINKSIDSFLGVSSKHHNSKVGRKVWNLRKICQFYYNIHRFRTGLRFTIIRPNRPCCSHVMQHLLHTISVQATNVAVLLISQPSFHALPPSILMWNCLSKDYSPTRLRWHMLHGLHTRSHIRPVFYSS